MACTLHYALYTQPAVRIFRVRVRCGIYLHIYYILQVPCKSYIFIHTIKYDNIYSTLKVSTLMRNEQYIKRYNWDISPENGKGFAALFLICSE